MIIIAFNSMHASRLYSVRKAETLAGTSVNVGFGLILGKFYSDTYDLLIYFLWDSSAFNTP